MIVVPLVISYLVGSLPFGLWLSRALGHVDVREHGSGNIGATNVWRVLGWRIGLLVFLLDLAKGLCPVLMARRLGSLAHAATLTGEPSWLASAGPLLPRAASSGWLVVGCGLGAILGHNFSPFLGFRGGKGVATSCGVALGMSWKAGLAGFLVWALVLSTAHYMSVASLIGTPVGAAGIWLDNRRLASYGAFALLSTLFVIVKHRANVQRLRAGTEPRFTIRSDKTR